MVFWLSFAVVAVHADSYDERRIRAGARLFRTMLAADTGLDARTSPDGALHILVYGTPGGGGIKGGIVPLIAPSDPAKAAVRGHPLAIREALALPGQDERLAAVFLAAQPSPGDLDRLVKWSIERGVLVYSPFEGHVERGVGGGISIEAKVQPHVNLTTLEAAGIELKPFFLKVAKVQR
jgi:hypothetical protein